MRHNDVLQEIRARTTNQNLTSCLFSCASAAVHVLANRVETITHLRNYLYPYTTRLTENGGGCWRVIANSNSRVRRLHDVVPMFRPRVIEKRRRAYSFQTGVWAWDWIPATEALIGVNATQRTVEIYCFDDWRVGFWAHKVVRSLITSQLLQRGGVLAHAGGASLGGVGTLVIGPKGSGKTTTLLGLLRQLRFDYLSNDRVLIQYTSDTGLIARAWPTTFAVGVGTLFFDEELRQLLDPLILHELADRSPQSIQQDPRKFELSMRALVPSEQSVSNCRPRLLIWPDLRRTSHGDRLALTRLTAPDVKARLVQNDMFTLDEPSDDWLNVLPSASAHAQNLSSIAEEIAGETTSYQLTGMGTPSEIATFLQEQLVIDF